MLPGVSTGAEVATVKVASAPGIGYLPYYVMEEHKLFEKHAGAAGIQDARVEFLNMSGAAAMNDALLSGSIQFSSIAVPALLILWSKTKGTPQEIRAASALNSQPVYLNTRNPAIKTVKDFGEKDRIAVVAPKISIQAIVLQMAAANAFGEENYAKLDRLTMPLPHPDARDALLSGGGELTAHMATEPFASQELKNPKIHSVLTSYDVLGGPATVNVVATTAKFRSESPKAYAAFLAALKEAIAMIEKDKRAAAQTYVRISKITSPVDEVVAQLNDVKNPILFSLAPLNITKLSDFMHRVGIISAKPTSWKDVFFPEVHDLKGS
jgi:NitT/TauT family transport system substrate-binding protein